MQINFKKGHSSGFLSKQFFRFGKNNDHSQLSQERKNDDFNWFQVGINKIYKKKESEKGQYMSGLEERKTEETKSGQMPHAHKTNYQFRIGVKKKQENTW